MAGCRLMSQKARHAVSISAAERKDALLAAVQRDGKISFSTSQVSSEILAQGIAEQLGHSSERRVYIRADGRARYWAVAEVINSIRSAGIGEIGIITEPAHGRL
jgi:biopolymer transport protein TolR